MKNETKVLVIFFLGTLLLLGGGVFLLSKNSPKVQQTAEGIVYQIDYSTGYKIGSDSARVKLVEFSDFQCPACRAAEPFVQKLRTRTDLQFIYKHFPLPQHQNGKKAAMAAEAAGEQGKFWEMHDKIFATQNEWSNLDNPDDFFLKLASELNLDQAKFKSDYQNPSLMQKIESQLKEGNSLGVNATPTFFLNGKKMRLNSFSDLEIEVENALK